jgi:hypothetical protein
MNKRMMKTFDEGLAMSMGDKRDGKHLKNHLSQDSSGQPPLVPKATSNTSTKKTELTT